MGQLSDVTSLNVILGADQIVTCDFLEDLLLAELGFEGSFSAAKIDQRGGLHFLDVVLDVFDDQWEWLVRPFLDLVGESCMVLKKS